MRVLHVMNGAMGGAAKSTIELAGALQDKGVESFFVSDDDGPSDARDNLERSYRKRFKRTQLFWWNKKIRARRWKRPLLNSKMWIQSLAMTRGTLDIIMMARKFHIDVIHTNTSLTPEGFIASKILRRPHVWHIRERLGAHEPFPMLVPPLARHGFRLSDAVIANSPSTYRCYKSFCGENEAYDNLSVIENGLDLSLFKQRKKQQTGQAKVRVGMIGHLSSPVKNHARFIDIAHAAERLPLSFHIFGHIPKTAYASDLKQQAEKLGLKNLYFEGPLSHPAEIANMMDVLVVPNGTESFGRVAVEAMVSEVPVVAASGGGVSDVLSEQCGVIVPASHIPKYVDALKELLDVDTRASFGLAGRKRAQKLFDIDACADKVLRIYKGITS